MGALARSPAPGGRLYFTVERMEEGELERVYREGLGGGVPLVPGEDARGAATISTRPGIW